MTAKVRRNGAFAPLGANYADDDAVTTLDVAENDRAELLYVRSLAYCARDLRTEGFVSDVALDAGKVLRRSKGRRGVDTIRVAANLLVDLGLWDKVEGGFLISSWLKWNKSWEEVSGERRTDAARKRRQGPAESETTPPGIHPEAERTPPGLVAPKHVTSRQPTSHQEERSASPSAPPRLDVEQVCLAVVAAEVHKDNRKPTITEAWRTEARLMLDRDKRELSEVLALIEWTKDHRFWRSNIKSVKKLREQFDTLRLQRADERPAVNRDAQGRICPPGQESLPTYERFRQVTL